MISFQSGSEGATEKKSFLAKRSQQQLQEMLQRKQSLSLDLKRALPASPGDRSSSGDGMASSCDLKSFQDAISNQKFQVASALNSLPQSVPSSADTFHTAAADSPDLHVAFVDADTTQRTNDSVKNSFDGSERRKVNEEDLIYDYSSLEAQSKSMTDADKISPFANDTTNDGEEEKTKTRGFALSALPDSVLQDSLDSPIQQNPAMKKLNQRIARQRMMVMRCLEAGTPSKEDLNRQIMILQDLQRQQIELEVSLLEDERKLRCGDDDRLVTTETEDYVQNEPNAYCSVEPTNNSSAILLTVATTRSQLFRNNRPNTNNQETLSETTAPSKRSSSHGYSTVYLTVNELHIIFSFVSIVASAVRYV